MKHNNVVLNGHKCSNLNEVETELEKVLDRWTVNDLIEFIKTETIENGEHYLANDYDLECESERKFRNAIWDAFNAIERLRTLYRKKRDAKAVIWALDDLLVALRDAGRGDTKYIEELAKTIK